MTPLAEAAISFETPDHLRCPMTILPSDLYQTSYSLGSYETFETREIGLGSTPIAVCYRRI
jgi:hypothetical protein